MESPIPNVHYISGEEKLHCSKSCLLMQESLQIIFSQEKPFAIKWST